MITFEQMKNYFNLSDEVFNVLKKANIRVSIDITKKDDSYELWAYSENQMWNWNNKLEKLPEVKDVGCWYDNGAFVCTFRLK